MDELSKKISLNSDLTPIIVITFFLLVVAISIILLVLVYQKRQLQNLREKEQLKVLFEKEILETKLEIQEQTFRNISQEIHDNIGQELSLARLTINMIDQNAPDEAKEKLANSSYLIGNAIQNLRNLSRSINADYITELGLTLAIEKELEMIRKTGRFAVRFERPKQPPVLSHQNEVLLFRIFQELMNNILKHSNATEISVDMKDDEDKFVLRVIDNGKGFDTSKLEQQNIEDAGSGFRNMKYRSKMIGAEFSISSEPGKGTIVIISLPHKPLNTS